MWKRKNKHGPPLLADDAGQTAVTVVGTPLVGQQKVVVISDAKTIYATVSGDQWYDKLLALQSASPVDDHWTTVTFGLDREQAQILGAALLGLTDAQVVTE